MQRSSIDQTNSRTMSQTGMRPNSQDLSAAQRIRNGSDQEQASDREGRRSRASSIGYSSDTNRLNRARGQVTDAVQSALDAKDPNHTTFPPEVIGHLAAAVLQQLKGDLQSPTSTLHTVLNQSGTMSSAGPSPPLDQDQEYVPDPYRASEEAAQSSTPTSPRRSSVYSSPPGPKRPPSPPFSHGGLSEDSDAKEGKPHRPRADRTSTGGELTIIEKTWGEFFDDKGEPTIRLTQFLRGIAVHLIEDYEPKHSLVISPGKMQRYYSETKQGKEIYQWQIVFDDRTSTISRMYRDMEAQHHLTQDDLRERPDIPGLTPKGFETWMTMLLKAYPDEEFERLAWTATHMPVSNPDDRKERFPKELLRRQFPKEADKAAAVKVEKAILVHCGVRVQSRPSTISDRDEQPPQLSSRTQDPPLSPEVVTRDRHIPENYQQETGTRPQPSLRTHDLPLSPRVASQRSVLNEGYTLSQQTTRSSVPDIDPNALRQTLSEMAIETSPIEIVPPPPIERERKPYHGQAGIGKTYDNVNVQNVPEHRPSQSHQPPPTTLSRKSSTNGHRPPRERQGSDSKQRPAPISIHQYPAPPQQSPPSQQPHQQTYTDASSSSRPRRTSVYYKDPPRRNDRNRSPSSSRPNDRGYRHEESGYGSYHASSAADYPPNHYRSGNRPDTRPDNRPDDRYEQRGSFSGEQRQRFQSVSSSDGHRYYGKDLSNDEDYHRSGNGGFHRDSYPPPQQFPPTSYKGRA